MIGWLAASDLYVSHVGGDCFIAWGYSFPPLVLVIAANTQRRIIWQ